MSGIFRFNIRNSEPSLVSNLKRITTIFFLVGLLAYLGWLCYSLSRYETTLIYSRNKIKGLPSPIPFITLVLHVTWYNMVDGHVSPSKCQSYLGSSSFDLTTKSYIINFVAQDFMFPDPASHHYEKSVIRRITFDFAIIDPVYPLGGDARMSAILFDAESKAVSANSPNYSETEVNSTVYSNIYTLGKGQHNVFKIERTIRKFIIPSAGNVLIGRPHFVTLPMLSSTYATYPVVNAKGNVYAGASVEPSSYIVNTEIEKSNMTLLDVLSALGGMYSLIMAFYGRLYGEEEETDKKNEKGVNLAEWANDRDTDTVTVIKRGTESAGESTVTVIVDMNLIEKLNRIDILEKRQKSLEAFLQDYVVDIKLYKKFKKKNKLTLKDIL
ncbi:7206_t:CDS:2 [Paraglomus occultum]|uniref:7206_t:CDS:1 n=1 Tax=Paraglomus occultum TaxID=144539 RepID=A0A9N9DEB8_9GLOM|nr:7206_t:CDS:2 [Paraglomus occultum]